MLAFQTKLHHTLLEEDVESRLKDLLRPDANLLYETRKFKAGPYQKRPILIQAYRKRKKHSRYYLSPDALASLLSQLSLYTPLPGLNRAKHILLLPEFIQNENYLLTHLYSLRSQTLAIYLYPKRLDAIPKDAFEPLAEYSGFVPDFHAKSRLHLNSGGRFAHLHCKTENQNPPISILGQMLRELEHLPEKGALHSWLYPLSELQEQEKRELRQVHELYGSFSLPLPQKPFF